MKFEHLNAPGPRIGRRALLKRAGAGALGLLLPAATGLATSLLAGCARGARFIEAPLGPEPIFTLPGPGTWRVMLKGERENPWSGVMLRNPGTQPLGDLRFNDIGGADLLDLAEASAEPFLLLPGESLTLTDEAGAASSTNATSRGVRGTMLWELPTSADATRACFRRMDGLAWDGPPAGTRGGLAARPSRNEVWVEMIVNAPLPHRRVGLAWEIDAGGEPPAVWLSLNGGAWARMTASRQRVSYAEPLDLTTSVGKARAFILRIGFAAGEGGLSRTLRKLRLERELFAPGKLRAWRPGLNELSLAYRGPATASLEGQMLAQG